MEPEECSDTKPANSVRLTVTAPDVVSTCTLARSASFSPDMMTLPDTEDAFIVSRQVTSTTFTLPSCPVSENSSATVFSTSMRPFSPDAWIRAPMPRDVVLVTPVTRISEAPPSALSCEAVGSGPPGVM